MNYKPEELIYFYNRTLQSDEETFPRSYFNDEAYETKVVIFLLRYAVEEYLRWTPREMETYLNKEVLMKLKLYDMVVSHVRFPVEFDIETDYYYLAHLCYPKIIRIDADSIAIKQYDDIRNGKRQKFKKGFLAGIEGEHRMKICLRHAIDIAGFHSIEEAYDTIASSKKGSAFISDNFLTIGSRNHFASNLDFLHEALPYSQKNFDKYNYYKAIKGLKKLKVK